MKKLLLVISIIPFASLADVNQAMSDFYSNISATGNAATVVQTQSANIFSGGGFSTRSQSTTLQPVSFTPPSFNATCGNINFYSGAFSYLSNTDQLMAFLQNALITAAPLIFINALKAISPNLAGSIMSFFDSAQNLLNTASNSCQVGTYLGAMAGNYSGQALGNLTGLSQANSVDATGAMTNNTVSGNSGTNISSQINSWSQTFNDWANNAHGVLNPTIAGNDKYGMIKQQIANTYGSVIWRGIQSINDVNCTTCTANPKNVQDLANLIMSLTGDVVITPQDSTGLTTKPKAYEPLMKVENFYENMPSGQIVYNCTTNFDPTAPKECVNFNAVAPKTQLAQGFKEQVLTMVAHVQAAFVTATPLSSDDKKLIAMSPIPIFQMAQACADAGLSNQIQAILGQYSSEIAFMLTQAMVGEALRLAQAAVSAKNVKNNDDAKSAVETLAHNIEMIQNKLNSDSQKYMRHSPVEIIQETNFLRSMAQSMYSPSLVQKIQFAKAFNNH
ncbi:MAG: conjugal transfer protein TraH [Burkholderiales bacterium]|nr:conjugal transfer protein TraH [Burkholderiales bacterium]